jgi:uncharacterized repeat protein (TIGR01451 family)
MKSFLSSLRKIDRYTNYRQKSNWSISALRQKLFTLSGATLTTVLLLNGLAPAQAEGSKELTANGGYRPYLTYDTDTFVTGILDQTKIYVYAEAGEKINLGSSANNIGSGKIQYTKPNGSIGTCALSSTTGRIVNRAQETAGPFPLVGGYTPCIVTVGAGESGIWQIDFVSPNITAGYGGSLILGTAAWSAQATGNGFITAWDVTVIQGTSTVKPGRAYTNYFAASMGNIVDNAFNGIFYVVTRDGYQYKVNANGLDPFRFLFFSNNKGIYTTADNKPTYRSFDTTAAFVLPAGNAVHNPNTADTTINSTNKLFFNPIDSSLPSSASIAGGTTWLNPPIAPPPPPINLSLIGAEGTPNQTGQSLGGIFKFTSSDSIDRPYQIILDLNNNNVFGDGNDRVLVGTATPGINSVNWDGNDGLGVPAKSATLKAAVATLGGEVHFPLIDAESNANGFIFTRLNGPIGGAIASPSFNTDRIYYNDSSPMKGNEGLGGAAATPPTPANATGGVNSSPGAHKWGTSNGAGFGNATVIDTWAYAPEFSVTTLNIVVKAADLQIAKSLVGSLIAGQTTTYRIDVTNANTPAVGSINDVVGATVQDVFPPAFLNSKVVSCQVISGTGNCGTYGFTGNTFNATVDLNSGSTLRFEVQATLSATATGTITNSATVNRTKDIGDPVNQDTLGGTTNPSETSTATTSITPTSGNANVLLVKRITAINGVAINTYKDDILSPKAAEDNNANWPTPLNTNPSQGDTTISSFLRGTINAGIVKSGDRIEYTIYFLNSGKLDASGVRICDLITANQAFKTDTYGVGKDIQVQIGTEPTILDLTAANDGTDRAQVYAANASVPTACNLKTANGTNRTVDISLTGATGTGLPNLTVLPGSSAAGTPSNSYGFVRFTTIAP